MTSVNITEATAAIRAARRVKFLGYKPRWEWELKSTDGSYQHHLVYDEALEDVRCLSCEARYGLTSKPSWCRKRVYKWMEDHARTGTVPAPKKGAA